MDGQTDGRTETDSVSTSEIGPKSFSLPSSSTFHAADSATVIKAFLPFWFLSNSPLSFLSGLIDWLQRIVLGPQRLVAFLLNCFRLA